MVKEMTPLEAIEVADMDSSKATELFRRCAKIQGLGLRRGDRNGSDRERAGISGFGHRAGVVIRVCDGPLVVQYPGISARIPSVAEGATSVGDPSSRLTGTERERIEHRRKVRLRRGCLVCWHL